jgi:ABC-type glycerol-3-phosphate transport system substrate-binding protein
MFKGQATALDPGTFTVIPFWQGTGPRSATIAVAGDGLFITNYGENPAAAGEFVRWLHQPDQLEMFYETTSEFPCDDRFKLNTDNDLEQSIYDEIQQDDPAPYWPSEYVPADIVVSGINPLGAKILGGQTADDAFDEWTTFLKQWRESNVELTAQLEAFIAAVEG